jgi:hypothetical protein
MIKRIRPATPSASMEWQGVHEALEVELTSEAPEWPIEPALLGPGTRGWRADGPGPQTITLIWPAPIGIRRVIASALLVSLTFGWTSAGAERHSAAPALEALIAEALAVNTGEPGTPEFAAAAGASAGADDGRRGSGPRRTLK